MPRDVCVLLFDLRGITLELLQLLGFELPFDFQATKVRQKRTLARKERLRLGAQRLQALLRALCERRAVALPRRHGREPWPMQQQ